MEKECDGDTVWFGLVTRDTGIGMDEEFLKHAFDAYAQKNNPSLSSINGVGLGLLSHSKVSKPFLWRTMT